MVLPLLNTDKNIFRNKNCGFKKVYINFYKKRSEDTEYMIQSRHTRMGGAFV